MPSKQDRSLVGTWKSQFKKEGIGKRLLLGAVFILSLAFFLHYREVRTVSLDLNTKAGRYVLAEIGFDFPDTQATNVLKQEAMRDVDPIFFIEEANLLREEADIEKNLVANPVWRDKLPMATFQDLYEVKEKLVEGLLQSRFVTARTYNKMRQVGLPTEGHVVFSPESPEKAVLSDEAWKSICPNASLTQQYIIAQFKDRGLKFEEDLSLQNTLRQAVKNSVPLKMTYVEPGERIISSGETVSVRHMEIMRAMKGALYEKRTALNPMSIIGSVFMATIMTVLSLVYLRLQHRAILKSFSKMALLATLIVLTLALAKLTEYVLINKSGWWVDVFRYPVYVPFGTLLISILFNRELALIISGFLAVVLGVSLAIEYDHFLIVNLIASFVVVVAVRKVRCRKGIFEVCTKVWLAIIPVVIAFNLFENTFWTLNLLGDTVTTLLFLMATAVIVVGLLPILETTFDIITDMMLMEFIDPNHPLLRRLSVEAPGTYHHSIVLGAISEAAAQAVGANGLFCRVATLYHDVGKLANPQYFTENQFSGFNIHQLLAPAESAQVIISHVSEGVALAERYGLPESFIDIIREHHGTSTVYCFFHAQVDLAGGDPRLVDRSRFSYMGPKPRSKESAIIMVGDMVEAAFRSLEEATESNVTRLVERLVAEKIEEGQFEECQLTFEELGAVKKAMIRTLLITRHARIKYPEKSAAYAQPLAALSGQGV